MAQFLPYEKLPRLKHNTTLLSLRLSSNIIWDNVEEAWLKPGTNS